MIIATAGHVDHGKTSLVKALTGLDTDRLPEEKQRGMSIDIGFAYADLGLTCQARSPTEGEGWDGGAAMAVALPTFDPHPNPPPARGRGSEQADRGAPKLAGRDPVGFVDVPGHQHFVRNMLAGVAAIDLGLLVVAADDGPMPQTREHLAILQLLGVPACVVALTKIDRVAPERLAQAEAEVAELLADGPYAGAPMFGVAAPQGQGVDALRQHLAMLATRSRATLPSTAPGLFRLAVDRSFALAGAGRIVTGAVLSGQVSVGDAVLLSPSGVTARVRAIHAQNRPDYSARAGQRCALNLAGLDLRHAAPVRGDWVVAPAAHAPTERIDVRAHVLATEPRPLAQRSALTVHIGAAAVGARVAVLEGEAIAPGADGLAQLVLDRPIAAVHGDRFILRDAAAQRTVGGGVVLDPHGPLRGRAKPARLAQLAAWSLPGPTQALTALLADAPDGVALTAFAQGWNLNLDDAAALQRLPGLQLLPGPTGQSGAMALSASHWQALRERVLSALAAWHAAQPDSVGMTEPALTTALGLRRQPALARAAMTALIADAALVRQGLCLRLPEHRPLLSDADQALLARVTAQLEPAGLRPPIVGELATALALSLPTLTDFLQRAARLGQLVRIAPNRYFLPQTVPALHQVALDLARESPDGNFDAAAYRDRSGIGRNLTVQVLEFLDREGYTRFDGTRRWPLG